MRIFSIIAIIFVLIIGFSNLLFAETKYYITGEDRTTTQFYVDEDWPIVKQWNIDIIWVDTNSNVVGIESGGRCGVMKFKTTDFIDKENFLDGQYEGKKIYECDHFHWTLNHELERKPIK